jgi:hypothetical protein
MECLVVTGTLTLSGDFSWNGIPIRQSGRAMSREAATGRSTRQFVGRPNIDEPSLTPLLPQVGPPELH